MKEKIYDMVKNLGSVSFVNLSKIDGFIDKENGVSMGFEGNIILWVNISKEAINCINELINKKKIFLHLSSPLTYMIDGSTLNMPVVKSKRYYKKPHWLPCVFNTHPME
jgi:hypothetical protein